MPAAVPRRSPSRDTTSARPWFACVSHARTCCAGSFGFGERALQAREEALTSAQCRSPLGRRPYDLRHAAVSLWLNSGVPATEVARRAGHGVAVLLKIYAHCIDGQADAANRRITDAVGTQDTQPESEPGDEGDDDSAQAS
jgi:hypothetical protein